MSVPLSWGSLMMLAEIPPSFFPSTLSFTEVKESRRKSASHNRKHTPNVLATILTKKINERKSEDQKIRLLSQKKEPTKRVNRCLPEVLGSHLGPHNKGPGLRVQGLHQHLQAFRLFHSGTGTIIGLHGRQLSKEEWREGGPLSPRADFYIPGSHPGQRLRPHT